MLVSAAVGGEGRILDQRDEIPGEVKHRHWTNKIRQTNLKWSQVTPEDLEKEYEAMVANLSRRQRLSPGDLILPYFFFCRYPKEAAAFLASTMQKNRAMLRNISVASKVEEVQPESDQMSDVKGVREALVVAGREVKEAQEVIARVDERAGQLLAAAKILARTEGALDLL